MPGSVSLREKRSAGVCIEHNGSRPSPVIDMQIFALGAKRPLGVHMTMPADTTE